MAEASGSRETHLPRHVKKDLREIEDRVIGEQFLGQKDEASVTKRIDEILARIRAESKAAAAARMARLKADLDRALEHSPEAAEEVMKAWQEEYDRAGTRAHRLRRWLNATRYFRNPETLIGGFLHGLKVRRQMGILAMRRGRKRMDQERNQPPK